MAEYAWFCFCCCHSWNCLFLIEFNHKVLSLLWVWKKRLPLTQNLATPMHSTFLFFKNLVYDPCNTAQLRSKCIGSKNKEQRSQGKTIGCYCSFYTKHEPNISSTSAFILKLFNTLQYLTLFTRTLLLKVDY